MEGNSHKLVIKEDTTESLISNFQDLLPFMLEMLGYRCFISTEEYLSNWVKYYHINWKPFFAFFIEWVKVARPKITDLQTCYILNFAKGMCLLRLIKFSTSKKKFDSSYLDLLRFNFSIFCCNITINYHLFHLQNS